MTGLLTAAYAGLVLLATQVFSFRTPVAVAARPKSQPTRTGNPPWPLSVSAGVLPRGSRAVLAERPTR